MKFSARNAKLVIMQVWFVSDILIFFLLNFFTNRKIIFKYV